MQIQNILSEEIISVFPNYGKHNFGGNHYGYLITTDDKRVLYFYWELDGVSFQDVTNYFKIIE